MTDNSLFTIEWTRKTAGGKCINLERGYVPDYIQHLFEWSDLVTIKVTKQDGPVEDDEEEED